jgi:hypothetical protein
MGIGLGAAALAQAPELTAIRAAAPPRIDGKLDDACWQGKPNVPEFKNIDPKRPVPTQKTEVWVACDDDALYVAARCAEERMDMAAASITGHDAAIWHDECFEVFLMPGTPYYYHFAASVLGTQYDGRNDATPNARNEKPERWSAEWAVATQRARDGWTIEFAIPFACLELGAQRLAAPFRINLGREERRLIEFSCWPASGFHKSEEFAVLKGLTLAPERYGLTLKDVSLSQKVPGPNRFSAVVAENPTPGEMVALRARVTPLPDGKPKVFDAKRASAVGAKLDLTYTVPATGGQVGVTVECLDAQGKARVAMSDYFRVPTTLDASLDMPLHYRSDGSVTLAGRVAVAEAFLKDAKLNVALLSGRERLSAQAAAIDSKTGAIRVQFPLAKLTPGNYEIEAQILVPALSDEPVTQRFPFRVILGPLD